MMKDVVKYIHPKHFTQVSKPYTQKKTLDYRRRFPTWTPHTRSQPTAVKGWLPLWDRLVYKIAPTQKIFRRSMFSTFASHFHFFNPTSAIYTNNTHDPIPKMRMALTKKTPIIQTKRMAMPQPKARGLPTPSGGRRECSSPDRSLRIHSTVIRVTHVSPERQHTPSTNPC